ncbi:aminoglycoside phosphotransferase family protein [Streptomyces calidiresistens]|uniref:Phosphotransferase n=1 Tax=Streptomyces calidiresistens TaxID=1485586 RepID=A0A7W3T5H3_9ACTN|nr:phosphotransferase [Streptomyces calidiresistens]MBB0231287.1 phosphotransferase [Streptomyces calidiresistens]
MESRTKRVLTPADIDAALRASAGFGCRVEEELTDGWFNTAHRVVLDDGRPAVVKFAPGPGAPVLRYERGILATEAMVHRRLASVALPLPELIHRGPDFLVLAVLDGTPWNKVADTLPGPVNARLRRRLGGHVARMHTLRPADGRFGYPAPEAGLSAEDWPTAFTAMVEALLDDAARWDAPLGVTPDEVRGLVAAGRPALAEVTEPRLVHFDLWPGNVFVGVPDPADPAGARVTGLIDHERAFWGDPLAEWVSLAFCGDIAPDGDLRAGYRAAGGRFAEGPTADHRLALYRLLLGLILVIECEPRGFAAGNPDHLAYCRDTLAGWVADLRALSAG